MNALEGIVNNVAVPGALERSRETLRAFSDRCDDETQVVESRLTHFDSSW